MHLQSSPLRLSVRGRSICHRGEGVVCLCSLLLRLESALALPRRSLGTAVQLALSLLYSKNLQYRQVHRDALSCGCRQLGSGVSHPPATLMSYRAA